MAQALRAAGVDFEEIDVDSDPALEARYGEDVPVLLDAQGREICRHRLDPGALSKLG